MTDDGPGSAPSQPADEERAPGTSPQAPSPFSRESSAADATSPKAPDQPRVSGDPSGPAAPDPYGYPPPPAAGGDHLTYGPTGPGAPIGPSAYGQNQYPSAQPDPDPTQPYPHPGAHPYVPPGPDPWAKPTPPAYDPQGAAYGGYAAPAPGQGYEVNPYQGTYGGYAAYGATPLQHPQAVAALVTGLVGLVVPLVGIAAIVLGSKARRGIDTDPQRYTGRAMATAGFVLGIAGTVLWLLLALGIVGLVALVSSSS